MLLRQQSFRFLLLASALRLSVRHCRSGAALRAKAPPFGYLASLACKHIANVNKRGHIESINAMLGYETPLLTTPFELLEIEP